MKKILVFLGLLLVVTLFGACGGATVEGITISSEGNVRTVAAGETLQLTAKVFPEKANQEVDWASSDETLATVDAKGLVTALLKGEVSITATSKANDKIKQTFSLIIEEGKEVEVPAESITLTAENNVTTCKAGETLVLSAIVNPAEANQSVEWSSSDETVATVSRGTVTGKKEGTVVITATARNDENVKATISLTITKSDDPTFTKDWENMELSSHETYLTAENETPLKVKGVVTHVCPEKDGAVNYYIQNGNQGFYVYAQDAATFPVEVGKVYEVGGFKKYYRGLNEIVDVEYFKAIDEKITYSVNALEGVATNNLDAVAPFHCSFVSGKAVLVSASVATKAYNVIAMVGEYETTFRVDPANMTAEEFEAVNKKFAGAVVGGEFEFVGIMSAFGYGTPSPQIQIIKADDVKLAELSIKDLLEAAADSISIATSVSFAKNEIVLPTAVEGFDATLTWSSSSELIDVATGKVNHGTENTKVTLTATLVLNGEEYKKSFEVLVFAADNTQYETVVLFDLEDAEAPNSYGNSASKSGYAEGTVTLGTPKATWMLRNALIAAATNDIYDGTMSIRAQAGKSKEETARIEIQQDGMYNVIEFATAVYGNDAKGIQIIIEYSTDSGKTWVAAEEVITVDSKTLETYRIKLPEGNKRVAIVVVENSGRRVNIDNIKLMK